MCVYKEKREFKYYKILTIKESEDVNFCYENTYFILVA